MRKALVVEDDADIVELVSLYLAKDGWDVESVADGKRALEKARRGSYQLIILDIQLPGRDGYELLEELKGLPERSWKVVALTAHALPEDRTRASAAGFDGYITKPIDVRTFPAEVARYLGG